MLLTDPASRGQRAGAATILIVDDNPVNLQVIVGTLGGRGHRLLVAREGRTALDIARRVRPDLVLLDVLMPEMGGFDVCRVLKSDPATRDATVIFLSALGEVSDKVAGLSLGAVDYITKPIQPDEVIARVDAHLTRHLLERELRRAYERLDRELTGAADMQRRLLPPTLPAVGRFRFAAHYQTSRHAGGDYYDVIPLDDGRAGVMVLDVSGHGAPAAIVMAMMRTLLHTHPAPPDDPAAVFRRLHGHFQFLGESAVYATAIYGVIDGDAATLTLACAGHPSPLLLRGGAVSTIACPATTPLLLAELGDVPCATYSVESGDRLLFYTDGITDREAPSGEAYEVDRLAGAVAATAKLPVEQALAALVAAVEAFAGGVEPGDDNTLLMVEVS